MLKTVLKMAWPAMLESFFVAFAGLVDSLMVSSLGSDAVAAVGLTTQPKFIALSLFFALNISLSALVARRFGQKERQEANCIFVTAFLFLLCAAAVLSTLFVLFADNIMRLCGSTNETHALSVTYFKVIMGGMIFNCIQMGINAAQRGSGNTQIAMRTNVVSNTVNIIGNYLLIGGKLGFPRLGITGAALATVLGTLVASIMSVLSICKKNCFVSLVYIVSYSIRPAFTEAKRLFKVGYSIFLEK